MKEKPINKSLKGEIPKDVVVDYAIIDIEEDVDSEHKEKLHKILEKSALLGVKLFLEHWKQEFPDVKGEMKVYKDKIKGWEISLEEFFGNRFDIDKNKLIENKLNNTNEGYAYAFIDPPYGIQGSKQNINKIFLNINRELFYDFKVPFYIYKWNTEWSDYFEPGLEWWGTFYWTIFFPTKKEIVIIGASTSD